MHASIHPSMHPCINTLAHTNRSASQRPSASVQKNGCVCKASCDEGRRSTWTHFFCACVVSREQCESQGRKRHGVSSIGHSRHRLQQEQDQRIGQQQLGHCYRCQKGYHRCRPRAWTQSSRAPGVCARPGYVRCKVVGQLSLAISCHLPLPQIQSLAISALVTGPS